MLRKQTRCLVSYSFTGEEKDHCYPYFLASKTQNARRWSYQDRLCQHRLDVSLVEKRHYSFLYTTPSFMTNFTFPMTWMS